MKTVRIGGLDTAVITLEAMAEKMTDDCLGRDPCSLPKLVFSSNGQGISLAARDRDFYQIMQMADMIHADGMSVVNASRLMTNTPLPERCSTTDFFHNAARAAVKNGLSFYILGGREDQNRRAADAMQRLYPGLKIVGRRNGYFSNEENEAICTEIVASGADVLWVALGKPKQEFWSFQNRDRLRGIGWIKTCGGLFGYLVGDEKRAPYFMQRIGAEWLWRAILSPRRLGWRYLITNPHAMWQMFRHSSR